MRPRSMPLSLAAMLLAGCAVTGTNPSAPPKTGVTPTPLEAAPSGPSTSGLPRSSNDGGATGLGPSLAPSPAVPDILDYRGDAARTGNMPGPGPVGVPSIRWSFKAGAPIGSQVAVVDRVVYLVSTEGTLHALDLETGMQRWSVPVGARVHASLAIADSLVMVAADDGAHAFATSDGHTAWVTSKTGPVRGTPAVIGHTAVFASDTGTITALDTRTGSVLWMHPVGAPDETSVAATNDSVVVGLQNGVAVALALADGTERWRTDTGDGARIGTPAIADGRAYIATLDGAGPGTRHIRALDLTTGRILWSFASPGDKPAYTPAVADGRAIVEGEDGSVTALDPATGTVLWQAKAPGPVEVVAAVADGVVYGASNGGFAFALDAATGAQRWRLPIRGVPYGVAVTSGLVLLGTDLGTLYAIGGR